MKNTLLSIVAVVIIAFGLIFTRFYYSPLGNGYEMKVTTSDALGYYLYLPGTFIYKDVTQLDWLFEIEEKYHVTGGGRVYQIHQHDNGNYVFKYFGGIAVLETPFFAIAHQYALHSDFPPDGFSAPYQWAIAFGNVFYAIISVLILRLVLLRYFSDRITAATLLLIVFATNLIQYISVDSAQSHGYIFPLYSIVLYATLKWHEKPKWQWAILAGWVIGMATMARPTEALMIFIPIFWGTQNKEAAKEKWALVKTYKKHAYAACAFGFLGVLPQLIYWKHASGSWIFDVGSKWTFANPWFRVLVGFEKGWFIYTPITILFLVGMFFIKKFPFKKSVLWFGLLNIYIVISWFDWRYGGSYSTRALSQATPVYALPLAALLAYIFSTKWKWPMMGVLTYLMALNIFQVYQYNLGVIHFDDMNARYYCSVYWDSDPSPEQTSLLDTEEYISNPEGFNKSNLFQLEAPEDVFVENRAQQYFTDIELTELDLHKQNWVNVKARLIVTEGFWSSYFNVIWKSGDGSKEQKIRVFRPRAPVGWENEYSFYFKIPQNQTRGRLFITLAPDDEMKGTLINLKVDLLTKETR
ncbi:MAG: glycosyltransferase family 39 protein [Salibacteraceae bacterium]